MSEWLRTTLDVVVKALASDRRARTKTTIDIMARLGFLVLNSKLYVFCELRLGDTNTRVLVQHIAFFSFPSCGWRRRWGR